MIRVCLLKKTLIYYLDKLKFLFLDDSPNSAEKPPLPYMTKENLFASSANLPSTSPFNGTANSGSLAVSVPPRKSLSARYLESKQQQHSVDTAQLDSLSDVNTISENVTVRKLFCF